MATWVALQAFIRTDHATDFTEFVWKVTVLPTANCLAKAAATLKPEQKKKNNLDRLQIRKKKKKTLLFMSAATLRGQTVEGDNIPVVSVSV
jgi:hypothetical protein